MDLTAFTNVTEPKILVHCCQLTVVFDIEQLWSYSSSLFILVLQAYRMYQVRVAPRNLVNEHFD
jgi:hypothetical protein